ncbi:UDP-N-acetylmuramoyl-L-alanine--D-glutamate ligase [Sideroxydans lithotrophicus]|uniref:UDP-N-acetylmuramoylalanine--D-glutamate ligase n=1 Tax=Sideroxydans lithotrophicus (strain ES-1) TaxID=580332 RepID=D5CP25_SIDLE|nr:UDP-N-acetylmuramoyl-L-alanine--D-glutamate ligase [Sideroxydans lithotrophicus]ADE12946.1 UDP-N-acetylmuramoylalanine/D-glutamate ligase [Sideroxydans lithotrophicus ES-1]
MTSLRDKSVLVLGLGETGLSLARYLSAQGARVRVADSREAPPGAATLHEELPQTELHRGPFRDQLLQGIDRIVISPGVPVAEPLVQRAIARGIAVEGDIELLAQQLATNDYRRNTKVIAITGANGKTTVTSMVGAMCAAAGLDVQVAGNISPAVLDALRARDHQPQVWVLELSSFQLETTYTLDADAAVVLNVTEDHLDRYDSMDSYAAAKARIFIGNGVQVVNRDDVRSAAMRLEGRKQTSFGLTPPASDEDWGITREGAATWLMQGAQKILRADELQVTGMHNVANALAALALCRALGLPIVPLCEALRAFRGLPHRVEKVAEVGGITYYDDSKGTNVGATEAALKGLGKPAVVILGGDGKGQDFSPLKAAVAQHARAVVLIGRDAPLIERALQGCGKPVLEAHDMDEAVSMAAANAQTGDAVLMSPACASFDMYRNYLHRAEVFVAAVEKLKTEAPCSARH